MKWYQHNVTHLELFLFLIATSVGHCIGNIHNQIMEREFNCQHIEQHIRGEHR